MEIISIASMNFVIFLIAKVELVIIKLLIVQ